MRGPPPAPPPPPTRTPAPRLSRGRPRPAGAGRVTSPARAAARLAPPGRSPWQRGRQSAGNDFQLPARRQPPQPTAPTARRLRGLCMCMCGALLVSPPNPTQHLESRCRTFWKPPHAECAAPIVLGTQVRCHLWALRWKSWLRLEVEAPEHTQKKNNLQPNIKKPDGFPSTACDSLFSHFPPQLTVVQKPLLFDPAAAWSYKTPQNPNPNAGLEVRGPPGLWCGPRAGS